VQYRALRQPKPLRFSALTGWEAPDPSWWTSQGFAVVNADSRSCGHSDGSAELLSQQEVEDTYDVVQWIAGQPWCEGNVVMLGVSYLAISQYAAAALQPPVLRAICPWEVFTDAYRDLMFPGGVREVGLARLRGCTVYRTAPDRQPGTDARRAPAARRLLAVTGARTVRDQRSCWSGQLLG
jgi:putative CocE/NonD family hydrolase